MDHEQKRFLFLFSYCFGCCGTTKRLGKLKYLWFNVRHIYTHNIHVLPYHNFLGVALFAIFSNSWNLWGICLMCLRVHVFFCNRTHLSFYVSAWIFLNFDSPCMSNPQFPRQHERHWCLCWICSLASTVSMSTGRGVYLGIVGQDRSMILSRSPVSNPDTICFLLRGKPQF